MDTVTNTSTYGSVERFTEVLRKHDDRADFNATLVGIIEAVSDSRYNTDAESLRFVRNALAAAEQVREARR